MRMIITESGKRFSISSKPCPPASLTIPLNVTFITDPVLSAKFKKLPLRNNNDSRVVNDRYKDCTR